MNTSICMHMYKYHRYIIHTQVHMKAWSYTILKHMYKHICISMQVCTQLNMYIHCTYIHVHRLLHPHEHTCTQTQIYLLLLSLLPVSNPLAFHKDELWSLCYGYTEPQEHLKLIWFYSTSICAQLPEGPCRSHFLKWKCQVLVSSTLPEEEERRDLSAGDTEGQILNYIMFSKIILPPKTAGCPLIKGYLILYLQHPVGRDTALWRSSHLVNSHSGALWNLCINATHGSKQSPQLLRAAVKFYLTCPLRQTSSYSCTDGL